MAHFKPHPFPLPEPSFEVFFFSFFLKPSSFQQKTVFGALPFLCLMTTFMPFLRHSEPPILGAPIRHGLSESRAHAEASLPPDLCLCSVPSRYFLETCLLILGRLLRAVVLSLELQHMRACLKCRDSGPTPELLNQKVLYSNSPRRKLCRQFSEVLF